MSARVVVTGAGAISSLGNDWQAIKTTLKQLKNRVRYMSEWDVYPELRVRLASPVDDFELPSHYRKKQTRSMGRVAQMAVRATELAIESADLSGHPIIKSGKTGIAYGSATGSSAAAVEFFSLLENYSMERINPTTYLRMMSHTAAVNLEIFFGTTGRVYTTSSACTAGSQGIGYAYEAIRSGAQTIMLAGGAEELCPTQAAVFDVILAACVNNSDPDSAPAPFDSRREGLVLGEGACTLILENLDHALARNATILAEVIGFGTNCDGAHLVRPQVDTMKTVMQLAIDDAGINACDVDYVSAHATATQFGDIAEAQATHDVIGPTTPVSSLKSYMGHSLGACGAIEAWTTIMMMNEGWFAPTLNLDSVDSKCAELDFILNEVRSLNVDIVMSNNFAFGGINSSLLFRRFS